MGEGWAIPTTQPLSAPLASQLNFLENSMDFFYCDFISNLYCKIAFFGLLRTVALRSSIPSRREARFQIWLPNRSALPASHLNFLGILIDFFYYDFVSNLYCKIAFFSLLRPVALWSKIPGAGDQDSGSGCPPGWFRGGFPVVSRWFPAGFAVVSWWFLGGSAVVSGWFRRGFAVVSGWFLGGFAEVSGWFLGSVAVVSGLLLGGFLVVSRWFRNGFKVVSRWFRGGFAVVSRWFLGGF